VVDGIPIKIITDQNGEDTPENPQKRACARGRAQISNITSADRIKYPMKRKNWEPGGGDKSLRGQDEWVRISWDEAMDIFSSEMKKILDDVGTRGILVPGYEIATSATYFDMFTLLLYQLGGALYSGWGTVSMGSWPLVEIFMTGTGYDSPDSLSIMESDLHVLFGFNWMANKGGNTAWQVHNAKEIGGGKVIVIDPWLNQTAQGVADDWVAIRPGTDTTLVLGMAYHMIENNLHNQDYLDKYCIGFDADHMPEGAPKEDNWKDYVLGTYDKEPKTPEWASKICGVPAARIKSLAEEIAAAKKVNFFAGQSTTKIPAGEMFAQAFYTLAFMHGDIGSPGNYVAWSGLREGMGGSFVTNGDYVNAKGLNPAINNFHPPKLITVPDPAKWGDDWDSWDWMEYSETWQSGLDGMYGRDSWPGGKKPVDIRMIYTGGYQNGLNSLPHTNAAIDLFRTVDFVVGSNPFFCSSVRYADLVLPMQTWWEKSEQLWSGNGDCVYWSDKIIAPFFEARTETEVAVELAGKLGVDASAIDTMTEPERIFATLQGANYQVDNQGTYAPLLTITQEDIDEFGVEGAPQEGLMTIAEIKDKGFHKVNRSRGDNLGHIPFAAFYNDPEGSPANTASGKFEIYCGTIPAVINTFGFSTLSPIGKWQEDSEQGWGAQTEEYPLLLWTPHSLRRAHTVNDSVTSLREAFPQECFMSTVDAEARGINNGDIVLMSSPYGQVLRPAKVMPTVIPGAVALQDGAWTNIDEATGIDIGGNPNVLQAPKASGQGSQSWTGTLCQVEKYTGNLKLEPDKHRALVLPKGIE